MGKGNGFKRYFLFVLMMVLVLFCGTQSQANLVSTFDTSTEGWTVVRASDNSVNWGPTGGNPGGFLSGVDQGQGGGVGFFMSPSSWNGDWTGYKNGQLKYDLAIHNPNSRYYQHAFDVQILSGSTALTGISVQTTAWTGWKTFEVPLTAASFGNDPNFDTVMANVTGLYIRAEYLIGYETEKLDNVRVTGTAAPVPEPATMLLLVTGLVGLASTRLRRKKQ